MIARNTRPLTAKEAEHLRTASRGSGIGCSRWFIALAGGPLVGMLIFAALGGLLGIGDRPVFGWLMIAGAALGLGAAALSLRWEAQSLYEARERDRRVLESGRAEVLLCAVADAIQVEEVEDEGPGFFLDVEEGQLLFLQGQYLYDSLAEGEGGIDRFPNRTVEVVRLQGSGVVLALTAAGEPFAPSRVRGPLTQHEYFPADGELIPARLATLDEDLRRLARERSARG
jgi:hypothetical protein